MPYAFSVSNFYPQQSAHGVGPCLAVRLQPIHALIRDQLFLCGGAELSVRAVTVRAVIATLVASGFQHQLERPNVVSDAALSQNAEIQGEI